MTTKASRRHQYATKELTTDKVNNEECKEKMRGFKTVGVVTMQQQLRLCRRASRKKDRVIASDFKTTACQW